MKEEIEDYIGSCTDCIIRKPEKLIKTSKIIETIQPLYQFIVDLYQIPKDICEAAAYKSHIKYKYVLTCVNHFSKYLWRTLIENKKGISISKELEFIQLICSS